MRSYKAVTHAKREKALKEINDYMAKAAEHFGKDREMARKFVQKARRAGMRLKVAFPGRLKKMFCKHCHSYLKQGVNVFVRTTGKSVVYHCKECKGVMRFRYK